MPRLSSVLVACASTICALVGQRLGARRARRRRPADPGRQSGIRPCGPHQRRRARRRRSSRGRRERRRDGHDPRRRAERRSAARSASTLPPGEYVLRARVRRLRLDVSRTRPRARRARSSSATSRSRARASPTTPVLLASAGGATQVTPAEARGWRCGRAITRIATRRGGCGTCRDRCCATTTASDAFGTDDGSRNSSAAHGAFFDRAVEGSARLRIVVLRATRTSTAR